MHRDALADLGASLRRELGDRLDCTPTALAHLAEDARRWLGTWEGEMLALASWLTSSSVWVEVGASSADSGSPESRLRRDPHPLTPSPTRTHTRPGEGESDRSWPGLLLRGKALDSATSGEAGPGAPEPIKLAWRGAGGEGSPAAAPTLKDPTAPFTPVKNLHDLARQLSNGEGNDEVSLSDRPKSAGGYAASSPVETPRGASPPPEVPAASGGFLEWNAAAGDAPRGASTGGRISNAARDTTRVSHNTVRFASEVRPCARWERRHPCRPKLSATRVVGHGHRSPSPGPARCRRSQQAQVTDCNSYPNSIGVSQETAPAESNAEDAAAPPPQKGADEVDVEPILDALARSVADEYKRFYGS